MGSAVVVSGVHVTVVAMVSNASGIRKAFPKFIHGIIVIQTNATLHALGPSSSHVESLRSVWSWSVEIFEAHIHAPAHRQTEIPCFYREILIALGLWSIAAKSSIWRYKVFLGVLYHLHLDLFQLFHLSSKRLWLPFKLCVGVSLQSSRRVCSQFSELCCWPNWPSCGFLRLGEPKYEWLLKSV